MTGEDDDDADPTPFQCPYCREQFALEIELNAHLSNVHPGERR